MWFGTRVLSMVGLLAARGRLAAAATTAGRGGDQWRGGSLGYANRGRVSGILMGKDER
ncbi:MAG: hypothetical protein ACRDRW_16545 [Pseudonocardiaceae bacterium]